MPSDTQKRLIPVLLIRDQGLMKSSKFDNWVYVGDVINTARIFNDKDVDELVIIDTQASRRGEGPDFRVIEEIASECFLPIGYGGGVRSNQDAKNLVKCGVDKVLMNSGFLHEPEIVKRISDEIGSSSTVVSLDVDFVDGDYVVRNPLTFQVEDRPISSLIQEAENQGAGELLIQSVNRDGTKSGPDINLCHYLSRLTQLPLIYAGGVASLEDASEVWKTSIDGVAAGAWFVFSGSHSAVLVTYPSRRKINGAVEAV